MRLAAGAATATAIARAGAAAATAAICGRAPAPLPAPEPPAWRVTAAGRGRLLRCAAEEGTKHEKIEGKVVSADKLYSQDYLFQLPMFQRPYDWSEEIAMEVMEDLLAPLAAT